MDRDPPNPYKDLAFTELFGAVMARAGQLLAGERVSRRDTAYLLIAAGWAVHPPDTAPTATSFRVADGETPLDGYLSKYLRIARDGRHHTIKQAIDACGLRPSRERRHLYAETDEISLLATRDDDGLIEALKRLERLRVRESGA